ncbi:translation initiation factor eIF-2B epsilon subunit, GEF [Scheffersomyces coipomensis]|uniref:translation initiation factor eIF-2B epsilon subunit, GEF n=1 Tax=Scheffersomyces coipomensis TaxID=1788519 RepID=UPI00315D8FD1
MPPKNKKQKEDVQDERFQAIVLTDSFQTRFMPLTSVKPRCLLPLANVPLIEYTLEFLAKAGVNEVHLMCSAHAEQVQQYIESSKWSSHDSPFNVYTIMSLESRSVGDAMRDLDNRGLISGDFLLVSGDVVTNIDFSKVMNFHKFKKQQDKDHIITMVLTPASPLHRTRSHVDPATFILDKKTSRCLFYQGIPPVDGKKASINVDPELFEDVEDEIAIRNDLIDCHVDICTPHVPQIFQENFDYQYLRNDFVKGVVTTDLVKKTIYAYISDDSSEYAARVESWATYDAISQDVLARWCYPLVPDSNLIEGTSYTYESKHIYKEEKVVLAQSCKIGSCTSIGANSSVGEGSIIKKSVIGRNCKIGKNVTISNSYVWDGAIIEDNTEVNHTIVASNAHIGSSVTLNPGTVIGFNVKIGNNRQIAHNSRISEIPIDNNDGDSFGDSFESDEDDDDEDENMPSTPTVPHFEVQDIDLVGEDGVGFLYVSDKDFDDESESEAGDQYSGIIYQMKSLNVSDDSIASISNRNKSRKHSRKHSKSRRLSTTSMVSTDYDGEVYSEEEEDFIQEATATVDRSLENNHDLDTAMLELNTLRMSMNANYHDVREATTESLLKQVLKFITTGTLTPQLATKKIFERWGPMYERQIFEPEDGTDLLNILEEKIVKIDKSYNQVVLCFAIQTLYDVALSEETILGWWNSTKDTVNDNIKEVRTLTEKFITWLETAEEESEEESDEDSD